MKVVPLGHAPLIIERPAVRAADPASDALFASKAALRAALSMRERARALFGASEVEVERLSDLVKRLEGRTGS